MADAKKLGLQLSMTGPAAERFKFAQEAEGLGYSSLWVAEVSGPDALVTLGALAVNTSKAELATGVIPMQIRTPGVNAMAFLTIHELSGGWRNRAALSNPTDSQRHCHPEPQSGRGTCFPRRRENWSPVTRTPHPGPP